MKLTKQQRKIYDYIASHPGATTHDIMRDTFVQCPSGRITELRQAGVDIRSIGKRKYPGAHSFECYAIGEPLMRAETRVEIVDGRAIAREVQVPL